MTRHGLRVPASMTSLSKALLTLDGTLRVIDPAFELASEATAAADALAAQDPDMTGDLLQQELRRSLPALRTLPEHADELATQLRSGRLSLRVERFAGRDEAVVSGWIDRVLVAVFGGDRPAGLGRSSWWRPSWPASRDIRLSLAGHRLHRRSCSRRSSSCGRWPRSCGASGPRSGSSERPLRRVLSAHGLGGAQWRRVPTSAASVSRVVAPRWRLPPGSAEGGVDLRSTAPWARRRRPAGPAR